MPTRVEGDSSGSVAQSRPSGSVAQSRPSGSVAQSRPSGSVAPLRPSGSVAPLRPSGSVAPVVSSGSVAPLRPSGSVAQSRPSGSKGGPWLALAVLLQGFFLVQVRAQTLSTLPAKALQAEQPSVGSYQGARFESVTIGKQTWMKRNLDVVTFRNGDTIPEAASDSAWMAAAENETPAWCYYNNDPANGKLYGRLYNWYVLRDRRGLAPQGWHLPSDPEWKELIRQLDTVTGQQAMVGAESVLAGPLLKTVEGWKEGAIEANDSTGFSALPGGYRVHWNIEKSAAPFYAVGESANWWSTTPTAGTDAWLRNVYFKNNQVKRYFFHRGYGFSVRCLKGEAED